MVKDICQDGAMNLVIGICNRAALDILEYPPTSKHHQDAAAFYRSDYFTFLTGMEGAPILEELELRGAAQNYKGCPSGRRKGR